MAEYGSSGGSSTAPLMGGRQRRFRLIRPMSGLSPEAAESGHARTDTQCQGRRPADYASIRKEISRPSCPKRSSATNFTDRIPFGNAASPNSALSLPAMTTSTRPRLGLTSAANRNRVRARPASCRAVVEESRLFRVPQRSYRRRGGDAGRLKPRLRARRPAALRGSRIGCRGAMAA